MYMQMGMLQFSIHYFSLLYIHIYPLTTAQELYFHRASRNIIFFVMFGMLEIKKKNYFIDINFYCDLHKN